MIKDIFAGKSPFHLQMNTAVRALVVSDGLLWSAWNFVAPIFAVFAVQNVEGGSVEIAASGYSVYLVSRVMLELVTGKILSGKKNSESKRFLTLIVGMTTVSLAYIGFSFTTTIAQLFLFYALLGAAVGATTPARLAFFSIHLDKDKESLEWGVRDASVFGGMAMSAALGGFIAQRYGFQILFLISAIVNILALIPHMLYMQKVNHMSIFHPFPRR